MAWFEKLYEFIMAMRAKAAALVDPIKQRIREILRGDGDGWSSRTLRLIQRFRKSVHEARVSRRRPAFAARRPRVRPACFTLNADAADAARRVPSAVIAMPASANTPETQASTIMPVMMVADASTMPIWKAAEASSK